MGSIIVFAKVKVSVPDLTETAPRLSAGWLPHVNQEYYEANWMVLPLKSPGGKINRVTGDLMGQAHYSYTPYIHHFPEVQTLV